MTSFIFFNIFLTPFVFVFYIFINFLPFFKTTLGFTGRRFNKVSKSTCGKDKRTTRRQNVKKSRGEKQLWVWMNRLEIFMVGELRFSFFLPQTVQSSLRRSAGT